MILRWLIVISGLFLFTSNGLLAQSSTPGGSVRLTVLGGGNVDFVFNTMSDYKLGKTYTNWTILGISVTDVAGDNNPPGGDGVDDYTTWNLTVEADDADGDGAITGTNPANTIPFGSIELSASVYAGCGTCNVFGSPFVALTNLPNIIADGSNGGGWPPDQIRDVPSGDNLSYSGDQIAITYRCGVTTSLLGNAADYYSDDMIFILTMSP